METIVKTPQAIILYNNKNITKNISKYIQSITYTDYEKGQSDEVTITLNDFDEFFQTDWHPTKGDKLSVQIGYSGERLLNCGIFTIDESEFETSVDGDVFVIRALAASINEKIRQKNIKSYVNKTLVDIARIIAKKHGYTVAGSSGFIKIPYEAQYNESDIAFLSRIASTYGYIFKLTNDVITFVPVEKLEQAKTVLEISKKDIERARFTNTATKTYTACRAKYLSPKSGKLISYTAKTDKKLSKNETFTLEEKFSTKAQAMAATTAALKRGLKEITGSIDFKSGFVNAVAGVNINMSLNNKYSGRYHITQSTHTVTSEDYKTSIEVKNNA